MRNNNVLENSREPPLEKKPRQ